MRLHVSLLALLICCSSAGLAAELGSERASISLGVFITNRNTETRLDSDTLGLGTSIRLEDDLGLDSSQTVARLDGYYRFSERHRINFALFDLSRDSTLVIDEMIQFGDEIFDVNSTVSSDFDLTIFKIAYTYSFLTRDRGHFGVTAGLYALSSKFALSEPNTGQFESDSLTVPLPVVGLRGNYALTPKLALRGSAELFAIEIDDVDGRFIDLYLGLDYHFHERFGIGLAYNTVTLRINAGSDFNGRLDWDYDGFLLYFKLNFGSIESQAL